MQKTVAKCYAQSLGIKSSIAFFPIKTQKKFFLNWHRKCIYIWHKKERKRVDKMDKMIFYVSDCCNAESSVDHEICSQCGEHCMIVVDDSLVSE